MSRKKAFDAKVPFQRLGKYNREKKGPAFIGIASVNGNQLIGIFAFLNKFEALSIRRVMARYTGLRHSKDEERWRGMRQDRSFENKKTCSREHIYKPPFQKD